jgi:hypothetical protein
MSKFYFHVDCDGARVEADEAFELPDIEAACQMAIHSAAEIAAEDLKMGRHNLHQVVVVADGSQALLSVEVDAALQVKRHC